MKKLLLFLCLPYIGISQQLTTENIFYDGNNRVINKKLILQ
jgi:hypothetical protein